MEYLNTIRNVRNILFKAFILNILFVTVFWIFVMAGWMQYFMWGMPGFTLEEADLFVMWLLGVVDIAGLVLFLVPALALTWEILRAKRRLVKEQEEFERFKTRLFQMEETFLSAAKPTYAKTAAGKPTKAKTKRKKKK